MCQRIEPLLLVWRTLTTATWSAAAVTATVSAPWAFRCKAPVPPYLTPMRGDMKAILLPIAASRRAADHRRALDEPRDRFAGRGGSLRGRQM